MKRLYSPFIGACVESSHQFESLTHLGPQAALRISETMPLATSDSLPPRCCTFHVTMWWSHPSNKRDFAKFFLNQDRTAQFEPLTVYKEKLKK